MLIDKIKKYTDNTYDLNCAETILTAANEEYNLQLDKNALKLMAAFGGGLGVGRTCGIVTAGAAVLSSLFVKDKGHESTLIKEIMKEFIEKFEEKLETDQCVIIKESVKDDPMKCKGIILIGGEILQEVIEGRKELIINS